MSTPTPAITRSSRRITTGIGVLLLLLVAGWALAARQDSGPVLSIEAVGPGQATTSSTATLDWTGNGSENASVECATGTSEWHWILTPGGPVTITGGSLTVNFADSASSTVAGVFNGNGSGAMHFYVTKAGSGMVTSASVSYQYSGTPTGTAVLTISDSECLDDFYPAG